METHTHTITHTHTKDRQGSGRECIELLQTQMTHAPYPPTHTTPYPPTYTKLIRGVGGGGGGTTTEVGRIPRSRERRGCGQQVKPHLCSLSSLARTNPSRKIWGQSCASIFIFSFSFRLVMACRGKGSQEGRGGHYTYPSQTDHTLNIFENCSLGYNTKIQGGGNTSL